MIKCKANNCYYNDLKGYEIYDDDLNLIGKCVKRDVIFEIFYNDVVCPHYEPEGMNRTGKVKEEDK